MRSNIERLVDHINSRIDSLNMQRTTSDDWYQFLLGMVCALSEVSGEIYWLGMKDGKYVLEFVK